MTTVPSLPRSGADGAPALTAATRPTQHTSPLVTAPPAALAPTARNAAEALLPVPVRTIAMGAGGMALVAGGGIGAAAVLVPDPILNGTAFSWLGYGHGKQLATAVLYIGLGLYVWSWIRLGRDAHAGRVDRRGVRIAVATWVVPLLFAPPLFSRDLFSYLAQGDLGLHGYDPYVYGVSVLNDQLSANVDPVWQNTHAPYGPLFLLIAKCVVLLTGQSTVVGVFNMRLVMCSGLALMCWSLPRLAARLGGNPTLALWFGAANPVVLVYLVGGGHNDLVMIGLLTAGTVFVLDGRHRRGIALVTLGFAVKATAGIALPFLIWIWAARLTGSPRERLAKAAGNSLAVVLPVFALCTLVAGVNLGWIPALNTSGAVVEWISAPTGAGQLLRAFASHYMVVELKQCLALTRFIGWLVLIVLVGRQWWRARSGEPTATLRRATMALFIVTVFSPATLPWYFSWPLVLAACFAWSRPALVAGCFASVWVTLVTYPTGTTALYDWGYLVFVVIAAALAATALVRPLPVPVIPRIGR